MQNIPFQRNDNIIFCTTLKQSILMSSIIPMVLHYHLSIYKLKYLLSNNHRVPLIASQYNNIMNNNEKCSCEDYNMLFINIFYCIDFLMLPLIIIVQFTIMICI